MANRTARRNVERRSRRPTLCRARSRRPRPWAFSSRISGRRRRARDRLRARARRSGPNRPRRGRTRSRSAALVVLVRTQRGGERSAGSVADTAKTCAVPGFPSTSRILPCRWCSGASVRSMAVLPGSTLRSRNAKPTASTVIEVREVWATSDPSSTKKQRPVAPECIGSSRSFRPVRRISSVGRSRRGRRSPLRRARG